MTGGEWEVELSAASQADLQEIVRWTARQFGRAQAIAYGNIIKDALDALGAGPNAIGVRQRDDIGPGYCTLHVGRNRSRGRHVVLFRVSGRIEDQVIRVVRILHDAMDSARHVPLDDET